MVIVHTAMKAYQHLCYKIETMNRIEHWKKNLKSERLSTCIMVNYSIQKAEHKNNEMDSSTEGKQN